MKNKCDNWLIILGFTDLLKCYMQETVELIEYLVFFKLWWCSTRQNICFYKQLTISFE